MNAPFLNASFTQSTFEMPGDLMPGENISVAVKMGDFISNPFFVKLSEPAIATFLFNGNEAVVQNGATGQIATTANPLRPADVVVLWGNAGIPREPACPGPGSVADATGNPLHRLVDADTRRVRLRAVTEAREVLFSEPTLFAGSPPGQLCNSVLQVNFALADAEAWSLPDAQAALAASLSLRDSDPDAYGQVLAEHPWIPVEDPVSGQVVAVAVLLNGE